MQPKVSVIVPVYNMEDFLPQCFQSIATQSFRNIEIILVDDGSSDKSAEMCDTFARSDNRVTVIHKKNGGLTSARSIGLDTVTGDYVLFVDSDDWLDGDMILRMVQVAQRDSADCVLCSYVKEFRRTSVENYLFSGDFCYEADDAENLVHQRLIGPNAEAMRHPERINNLSTTWGKLYTQETARRGLLVNECEVGYTEDTLFNIYALDGCRIISYVHACFYHYRKYNSASLTASYRPMLAEKWDVFYQYMESYIRNTGRSEYGQLLDSRIACGMIGLGINEIQAPVGFWQKVKGIRHILNRPTYVRAFKTIDSDVCPVQWKVFFLLCRYKLAFFLTVLLMVINSIRTNNNAE